MHFAILAMLFALVDPSLIPDGDYNVTVERVVDAKHLVVRMENGVEARLPATGSMTFDTSQKVTKAHIFVYKGVIITYKAG
ncbi:MAG TPA: hypothetical protein VFL13_04170 [Candidatus Baltobacteraceae bacterium]|nr:hypothetical protein [Candidatus Baltobacteraceae bacterium]